MLHRTRNTHIVCVFFYRTMRKILLVRHGESVANTEGNYQGITYDTPLSPLGEKQALALAHRLQKIEIDQILASPLTRTRQTAQKVAHIKKMNVELVTDIIETNHGLWESKHKDAIAKRWPEIYKKWQKFPSAVKFPEGDHFLDTQQRVLS